MKQTEIKLELLLDINMLQMIEKGIRGWIYHAIHWYAKTNNKYTKDYNQNKKSYLLHWDANNLYQWRMSQNLPVDNFEWEENIVSKSDESFIKNYDEGSCKG